MVKCATAAEAPGRPMAPRLSASDGAPLPVGPGRLGGHVPWRGGGLLGRRLFRVWRLDVVRGLEGRARGRQLHQYRREALRRDLWCDDAAADGEVAESCLPIGTVEAEAVRALDVHGVVERGELLPL